MKQTGTKLFVGAVGSYYWQGQALAVNTENILDLKTTIERRGNVDNSYLGYSVATGEFSGDNTPDVAVGMPRGANLTGKV